MKQINIIQGDITQLDVTAIVNAANPSLLGGGGVDGAIHRAAGPELLAECRTLHGCPVGGAKLTQGYRLPAQYVIHTPGPVWQGGKNNEPQLLRNSYVNSLRVAEEHGCATVAFPAISTGVYHYPLEEATKIALQTVNDFLANSQVVTEVTIVCYNVTAYRVYKNTARLLPFNEQVFVNY
ncbi:O-acetyl-ADP-ribose deacetylase [Ligilactobacillus saerimneri]|uniref:O-acetyl-ADP-ribose deacetylase n=1 Tax=Ligilactobacillus saerimneri TaxID=228229 RepID=UPI0024305A53|nr:O-acetyl-ADP-ribose deacetylase [Ligilactobacillus saerimneri]